MFGDVLAVHDRSTECVGGGVPGPVSDSVVVEGGALRASRQRIERHGKGSTLTEKPIVCPIAATPVPANTMVNVGLDPFEVMVTLPLGLPTVDA